MSAIHPHVCGGQKKGNDSIAGNLLGLCQQFIPPTCVSAETIAAIMRMTDIALNKRCSLHATQSTHFTIIPFFVNMNLLSYIHPHIGRHIHIPNSRDHTDLWTINPYAQLKGVTQICG